MRYLLQFLPRGSADQSLLRAGIEADRLPTLLLELSLNPQRALVEPDKLTLSTYSLFGLITRHEELSWEKVAGCSHRAGVVWDAITIETSGKIAATMTCLSKRHGCGCLPQVGQPNAWEALPR
ncbi:hypothetical protein SynRS9909_02092 [Synechococcus sp. RS9909]|nr:hypothetical protein RS9917_09471 [Synechococcus sp. RS9917]QNI80075.1 hypothetical protein SynRS9909_02092 [Synechococcus sp. RS9909]